MQRPILIIRWGWRGIQECVGPGCGSLMPKNCGCRPKSGVSPSITVRVPFLYLRLCKQLEISYSAICKKWAVNRYFWAGTLGRAAPGDSEQVPCA